MPRWKMLGMYVGPGPGLSPVGVVCALLLTGSVGGQGLLPETM
jgi:hypothetical protein